MHIDLEQLITFERIVREGSFSAAAWAMDVPQPTVSARIKTLEQTLGGSLFNRQGRKVALTEIGQVFLPYAQRAIAVLGEGVEMARQTEHGQRGRVTYGGLSSLSGVLMGSTIASFQKTHPHVELLVKGGDHETVVDWLRNREIELGFIVSPCPEVVMTPMIPLLRLRERVIPVVSPDHPLARHESVSYAELVAAAHPFLNLRWWKTLHPTIAQIGSECESITISMDSARHMVRAGVGLGFFTYLYISDDLKNGRLVELKIHDLKPIFRDSMLVMLPREAPLSAAATAFIACIREQAERQGIEILPLNT
jgi:DNA-binding transcriptional LysR family regulator